MIAMCLFVYSVQQKSKPAFKADKCGPNQVQVGKQCICAENAYYTPDKSCVLSCESIGLKTVGVTCMPANYSKQLLLKSTTCAGAGQIVGSGSTCVCNTANGFTLTVVSPLKCECKSTELPRQSADGTRCLACPEGQQKVGAVCTPCNLIDGSSYYNFTTFKCMCAPNMAGELGWCDYCEPNKIPNAAQTACVAKTACAPDYLTLDQTACTSSCGVNSIDLLKQKCIVAGSCGLNAIEFQNTCSCPAGYYINSDGSACTTSCPKYISIQGTQCVLSCDILDPAGKQCLSACGDKQILTTVNGQKQCVCEGENVISLTGKSCVAACGDGSAILNKKCVCQAGKYISADQTQCVSICDGGFIDFTKSRCVANCNGYQINLANKACVLPGDCGAGAVSGVSKCQCIPGYVLILNETKCVQSCEKGSYISNGVCVKSCGTQKIDLKQGSCVDASNCGANTKTPGSSCICIDGYIQNLQQTDCVLIADCVANSASGFLTDTDKCVCVPGFYKSAENTSCVQSCAIYDVTRTRCVTTCPDPTILSLNGTQCVSSCTDSNVDSSKNQCVCPSTKVIKFDGTGCVSAADCGMNTMLAAKLCTCAATFYLNLQKTDCVSSCGEPLKTQIIDQKCACKTGLFLKADQSGCVSNCSADDFSLFSLERTVCEATCSAGIPNIFNTACVPKGACGPQTTNENGYCQCTYALNLLRTQCVSKCEPGAKAGISVDIGKCVCQTGKAKASDSLSCVSRCPTGQFLNSAGTQCVSACVYVASPESGEVLNLQKNSCIPFSGCSDQSVQIDSANSACVCKSGKVVALNGSLCVDNSANCGINAEIITIDAYIVKCVCSSGYYLSKDQKNCENPCSVGYLNLNLTMCLDQCTTSNAIISSSSCVCSLTSLNLAKTRCIEDCADDGGGSQGGVCKSCTIINALSSFDSQCKCNSNTINQFPNCQACPANTVPDISKVSCVEKKKCAPGFLNELGTFCVASCSIFDVNGYQCATACGAGQTLNAYNQCQCNAGTYRKVDLTGCVANCKLNDGSILSLDGLYCVSNCDGNYLNTAGTQCIASCGSDLISLDRKSCVTSATCTSQSGQASSLNCVCLSGYVLKQDAQGCVSDCATDSSSFKNLAGTQCTTSCGSGTQTSGSVCQCQSGKVPSVLKTSCVSNCYLEEGSQLSLNGKFCVALGNCGTGSVDGSGEKTGFCVCQDGKYLSLTQICVSSCLLDNPSSFVNLAGTSCVTSCGANTQTISGACACTTNNYIKVDKSGCVSDCKNDDASVLNIAGTFCVQLCTPGFVNLAGTQCVASCGTDLITISNRGCITQTGCGSIANARIGRAEFNQQCVCQYGYFISKDLQQCVPTCSAGEYINIAGTTCVSSCGSGKINLNGLNCVSACGSGSVSKNGVCVCALNKYLSVDKQRCVANCQSEDASYLNMAKTACETTCGSGYLGIDGVSCQAACYASGQLLDITRKYCLSTCDLGQYNVSNECVCRPGFILNIAQNGCVGSLACGTGTTSTPTACACDGSYRASDNLTCISDCWVVEGSYLKGTQCVSDCADFGLMSNDLHVCVPCATIDSNSVFNTSTKRCECDNYFTSKFFAGPLGKCVQCSSLVPAKIPDANKEKCVASCTSGEFLDLSGKFCVHTCDQFSLNLKGTQCVKVCELGAKSVNGACQCDGGYVADVARTTCITKMDCLAIPALISVDKLHCDATCITGYKAGTVCVATCAPDFVNLDLMQCIGTCPTNSLGTSTCVCNAGHYLSLDKLSCVTDCSPKLLNYEQTKCVDTCGSYMPDETNKYCVSVCGTGMSDLKQTKCIVRSAGCGVLAAEGADLNLGKCICLPGNVIKYDQTTAGCEPSCSQGNLNIDGTACVNCADLGLQIDQITSRCSVCPLAYQVYDKDAAACVCVSGYELKYGICAVIVLPTCKNNAVLVRRTCECVNVYFEKQNDNNCWCKSGTYKSASESCSICPAGKVPSTLRTDCIDPQVDGCSSGYLDATGTYCTATCPNYINKAGKQCVQVCEPDEMGVNGKCVCNEYKGFVSVAGQAKCGCSGTGKFIFKNTAGNLCVPCNEVNGFNPALSAVTGKCTCTKIGIHQYVSQDKTQCIPSCSANTSASSDMCITNCEDDNSLYDPINHRCYYCSSLDVNSEFNASTKSCQCKTDYTLDSGKCKIVCKMANYASRNLAGDACVCFLGFVFQSNSITACWCPAGTYVRLGVCVACPNPQVPSIDRTSCVSPALCAPGYLSLNGTYCLSDCSLDTNSYANLAGFQCVYKANCGTGTDVTTTPNKCICDKNMSYVQRPGASSCTLCSALKQVPNADMTDCVSCTQFGTVPDPNFVNCVCDVSKAFISEGGVCICDYLHNYAGSTKCVKCEGEYPYIEKGEKRCSQCNVDIGFVSVQANRKCFCDYSLGFVQDKTDGEGEQQVVVSCKTCPASEIAQLGGCANCTGDGEIPDSIGYLCICNTSAHFITIPGGCACDNANNYAGVDKCDLCEGEKKYISADKTKCTNCLESLGFNPDWDANQVCTCVKPEYFVYYGKCVECNGNVGYKPEKFEGKCVCQDGMYYDTMNTSCVKTCGPLQIVVDGKCTCVDYSALNGLSCSCLQTFLQESNSCVCKKNAIIVNGACQCDSGFKDAGDSCVEIKAVPFVIISSVLGVLTVIASGIIVWYCTRKVQQKAKRQKLRDIDGSKPTKVNKAKTTTTAKKQLKSKLIDKKEDDAAVRE
ncbi:High_cysteine protein [Hexamita inflata]|uniref:High cysteine protein n=1 Tax=Hexamita inflata TaxID=28002 RepID=A0AA86R2H4_9EUKA|nr:High cysteine protein [Hexamita inflata]